MNAKPSISKFQIVRTIDDNGVHCWTVQRRDGKSFGDGWLGLNFETCDYEAAIEAAKKYEAIAE